MQLSRKQVILISVISGVVLLLTVAAALIFSAEDEASAASPTPTPTMTARPTASPSPGPTPSPTTFLLPLVPRWDTPRPTAEPAGAAGVFVPGSAAPSDAPSPTGTAGPWAEACDERARQILAVGLRDGRTAALLLMWLDRNDLTVAALPTDAISRSGQPLEGMSFSGADIKAQGAQAAKLVEEATGTRCRAWLVLDLSCLPAVLQITGPLAGRGMEALAGDGRQRAQGALSLAAGAAAYVQRVPLLKLPALKQAVGGSFASNLSALELWSLFWTIRSGVTVRGLLASGTETVSG